MLRALPRHVRPLAAAALAALAAALLGTLSTAASIPWMRYLFPTRIVLEPMGMLALVALLARVPRGAVTPAMRATLFALVAVVALGWGAWSTARGLDEARLESRERGVPATRTLTAMSVLLNQKLAPGEPLMSNLGPALAWQTNHPVVHLALAPADVEACRRRLDFHHVVLAFREPRAAWGEWSTVMARKDYARTLPLGVVHETRYESQDGFSIVWLELGPRAPALAAALGRPAPPAAR